MSRSKNAARSTSALSTAVEAAARVELLNLERRIMMHVDPNDSTHVDEVPDLGITPVITATTTGDSTTVSAATSPLTSIPALSSRPAAAAKLCLDFNGDTTTRWGTYRPGKTPAYDTDGDPTTFSDAELANIREIWQRVSEKYAPFNLDVTTTDPGNLTNGQTLKVVFGGDGAWLGSPAGGVAYVGGFVNSASNAVFVFPKNLGNGYAPYVAEAAAHESGHGFSLQHQGTWTGTTLTNEYAPANANGDAPIMGNSYTARRGLWWNGTASDAYGHIQDDLSVISSTNGFGYRADDFANTIAAASTLSLTNTSVTGAGVIEQTSDTDVFSFVSGPGSVNLFADVAAKGAMLDLKMTLRDSAGTVLAAADTASLGESLSANLTGGTYYLSIASHGAYGDIGQYFLRGDVAPLQLTAPIPAAPSGLTARSLSNSQVYLAWADNATAETGFRVYVSTDQTNWTLVTTLGADAVAYDHTGLKRNTRYDYLVRAYNDTGESADSNLASAKTDPGVKGDANLDGAIDFADLTVLSQNYNTTDGSATWSTGDFNGDGNVDFTDLTFLSQSYNTTDPTFATDTAAATTSVLNTTTTTKTTTTTTTTTTKTKPVSKPVLKLQPVTKPAARATKPRFSTATIRAAAVTRRA